MLLVHKHFTLVIYNHRKISLLILKTLHGKYSYFAMVISYNHKMFMKLTTGESVLH